MRKIVAIILCMMTICTCTAFAVESKENLQNQIDICMSNKDKYHQIAELARSIGLPESSSIIQDAKAGWNDQHNMHLAYQVSLDAIIAEEEAVANNTLVPTWTGSRLTRAKGVNYGPQGKETYYNLNMSGVVSNMRRLGYDATNYPYWVRNDGCKMLGPYILAAANLNHWKRGSIVESSLGFCIIADTGHLGWNQLDIAVTW